MSSDPEYKIERDAEGKLRATRIDGVEVCDFCLAPEPKWEYPAADMEVVSSIIDRSDDPWGACEECHRLLEASDIDGLIARMVREQPIHYPPSSLLSYPEPEQARLICRRNVLRFMDARSGPPREYTP